MDIDRFASIVVFEDNHLLAVCKPAGLLSQGDDTSRDNILDDAKAYIKAKYAKPGQVFIGLVHRLDRQVAGVMVLARTSKAAARLSAQFREAHPEKIYWAVVSGRPDPPEGTLENNLAWDGRRSRIASPEDPSGQLSRLRYRTLEQSRNYSCLEIRLDTGRRHQIRAQFSGLGHPILGDRLYGSPFPARENAIGLFAVSLTVRHPTLNQPVIFRCPPPAEWPWLPLEMIERN